VLPRPWWALRERQRVTSWCWADDNLAAGEVRQPCPPRARVKWWPCPLEWKQASAGRKSTHARADAPEHTRVRVNHNAVTVVAQQPSQQIKSNTRVRKGECHCFLISLSLSLSLSLYNFVQSAHLYQVPAVIRVTGIHFTECLRSKIDIEIFIEKLPKFTARLYKNQWSLRLFTTLLFKKNH